MDGFSLNIDITALTQADRRLENMVRTSAQIKENLTDAMNAVRTGASQDVIKKWQQDFERLSNTKISINADTKDIDKVNNAINMVVRNVEALHRNFPSLQLYDSQNLYATDRTIFDITKKLGKIREKIKGVWEEWSKPFDANDVQFKPFEAPKKKDGTAYSSKHKKYKEALAVYVEEYQAYVKMQEKIFYEAKRNNKRRLELRLQTLREQEKAELENLKWAKMTMDERTQAEMKHANKVLAEQKRVSKEARAEYRQTLSEMTKLMRSSDKAEKKNKDGSLTPQIKEMEARFMELNERKKSLEEEWGQVLVETAKKANLDVLNITVNRIAEQKKAERAAEEEAWQKYLRSPEGALSLAQSASSISDMREAQKYLQAARDTTNVQDEQTIRKLNDEYVRLRGEIERLTTAEKNEQALQPTLRNEYERLLKQLDKLTDARKRLEQTTAFKSGDAASKQAQADLIAQETAVQERIKNIKEQAGALVVEVERKHAAEIAMAHVEQTELAEKKKAELARQRLKASMAERSKYGAVSADSVNTMIDKLSNTKNAVQEEEAIKRLLNVKKHLNTEDKNYVETVARLDRAIDAHRKRLEALTLTQEEYEKLQAKRREAETRANATSSADNALQYSQSTQSINEQIKAISYLKEAREKLNRRDFASEDAYRAKVKELTNEIDRQETEVRQLTGANNGLRQSQQNMLNISDQLQRRFAALFSVQQIHKFFNAVKDTTAELELQHRSLKVLLRDNRQANMLWEKTVALATKSPFQIKELVTYTKQLAAYRIESSKLYDTTKMLGDISAGIGVDMQRLILAYGQVSTAKFLRATELRQFTEAGLPLLDELADRFSKLEGRTVSASDAFERISKRLVTFEDVDAVLRKMTSEGGIFYKMQEKQAETLMGAISNLKDTYTLMFDEIGQANMGVLRASVGVLKALADNWRTLGWAISSVAAGKLFLEFSKMKKALHLFRTGVELADIQAQGLNLTLVKLRSAFTGLIKTIVLNPLTATVAVVTSLVFAMIALSERMTVLNKKYDQMNADILASKKKYEELNEQIKQNNKIIEENSKIIDEHKNASKDDAKAQEKLKTAQEEVAKAQKANGGVLAELKTTYPDVASAIKQNEKQVLDLTEATEKLNTQLRLQLMLNQAFKSQGWFDDSFGKNLKDASEELADFEEERNSILQQIQSESFDLQLKIENGELYGKDLKNAQWRIKQLKEEEEIVKTIGKNYATLRAYTKEYTEEMSKIHKYQSIRRKREGFFSFSDYSPYIVARNTLVQDFMQGYEAIRLTAKKIGDVGGIQDMLEKTFDVHQLEGELRDFIRYRVYERLNKDLKIDLKWSTELTPENVVVNLDEWQQKVWDAMEKIQTAVQKDKPMFSFDIGTKAEFKKLDKYDAKEKLTKELNELKQGFEPISKLNFGFSIFAPEQIKNAQTLMPMVDYALKMLGNIPKTTTGPQDLFSDQLRVIKEIYQAYKELSKTFDDATAKEGALKKFGAAFKDAFKATPEQLGFDLFTEDGVKKAYQYLIDNTKDAKKKVKAELERGEIEMNASIKFQKEQDAKITDEIAKMFSGYEMSLELQKMNIPPKLAQQLFGVETTDLSQIRARLEKEIAAAEKVKGREDFVKQRKEELKRVEEMERNAQIERLKTYSQYLVKGMDERVKIKVQELRQIAELDKEKEQFTPQQYTDIRDAIHREAQEALDKQAWGEFKKSDVYVSLFEDLEEASSNSLRIMVDRLKSLRESLKDLPPEQLKEVVTQLEKAQDELEKRNPFKKFANDWKDYFGNIKKKKDAEQQLAEGEKDLDLYKKQAEAARDIVTQYQERIDKGEQLTEQEQKDFEAAKTRLAINKSLISDTEKANEAYKKVLDSIKKGAEGIGDSFEGAGEFVQALGSYVNDMASKWEAAFGLSDKAKDDIATIVGLAQGMGDLAIGTGKVIANPSDIGGYMQALSGLMTTISTVAQAGDKSRERKIQDEITHVKKLERAYEKLEKAIDKAYSIENYQENFAAAEANINAQISAYRRMISMEQDKKKTDKERIDEWTIAIEDLQEQLNDLREEAFSQATSGILADAISASEGFVDAWLDAFKETGDGLSGLKDNFREVMLSLVKRQAAMAIVGPFINSWKGMLEKLVNADDMTFDKSDAAQFAKLVERDFPTLSENLTNFFNGMTEAGVSLSDASGGLTGLQKGIQGITDAQADILASYLNSIRFYVATQDSKLTKVIDMFSKDDIAMNPMLNELKQQTRLLDSIDSRLSSIIGTVGQKASASCVKVIMG